MRRPRAVRPGLLGPLGLPGLLAPGPGFHVSHAVCRIVLGCLFVLSAGFFVRAPLASDDYLYPAHPDAAGFFWTSYDSFFALQDPALYKPIGPLVAFGTTPPRAIFFDGCYAALCVAGWCVAIGLCSRLSLFVATASATLLFALHYSYQPGWCHPPLGLLLPALAMLVGPRSTALSLDSLLARWRGVDLQEAELRARGPVLLAQAALGLLFLNAATYKIYLTSHAWFAWAFSDSLRNIIIMQHDKLGLELPAMLRYASAHPWAYHGLALGNLVGQLLPICAVFCVHRPWLRALCGGAFLTEMLGLGFVMGIWNPLWFPLVAFLIDWDRLWHALRPQDRVADVGRISNPFKSAVPVTGHHASDSDGLEIRPTSATLSMRQPIVGWASRVQAAYALAYLGLYLFVAFVHKEPRAWTYPFSSFTMYSGVHALRPYDEHLAYPVHGSRWKIDAEPPLTERELRDITIANSALPWSGLDVGTRVQVIRRALEAQGHHVRSIAIDQAMSEVPRFDPNEPACDVRPCWAARAYTQIGDRRISVTTTVGHDRELPEPRFLCVTTSGLANPTLRFGYYCGLQGKELQELPGSWQDGRYHYRANGVGPYVIVVLLRDEALGPEEIAFYGTIVER